VHFQGSRLNILTKTGTPVTFILIALCVLCFIPVAANALPEPNPYALYFPDNPLYHAWQYLSSMFMHGSIFHLLFNMLGLWMFGGVLERLWGSQRFLLFYLLCGIGAGIIYTQINAYQFADLTNQLRQLGMSSSDLQRLLSRGEYPTNLPGLTEERVGAFYMLYHIPVVGASGAIYGILVAYAMFYPNHKLLFIFIPFPIAAKYFVPAILLVELSSGITGFSIFGEGIAHFAHLGGAIVGFLLALLFRRRIRA
jgi:membrane associated rhomboid family serine protease